MYATSNDIMHTYSTVIPRVHNNKSVQLPYCIHYHHNSVDNMYIGCVNSLVITIEACMLLLLDCLCHTAEMVVVDTIWQLHTLIVMNSW